MTPTTVCVSGPTLSRVPTIPGFAPRRLHIPSLSTSAIGSLSSGRKPGPSAGRAPSSSNRFAELPIMLMWNASRLSVEGIAPFAANHASRVLNHPARLLELRYLRPGELSFVQVEIRDVG